MNGIIYQQKVAYINERDRQSDLNNGGGGSGGGFIGIIVLIELLLAFAAGMTMLDMLGSESLRVLKYSTFMAGLAGIFIYFILHKIPGIRWLMMLSMSLLWALFAYAIGVYVIGEAQDSLHLVTHKGPYIAAAITGLVRFFMYG